MITNQNDINNYKNYNKQYIPEGFKNNNWIYQYNGDYVHIITDQGCYMNYNTQYCYCYNYNWKTNVMEIRYECRRSDQYSSIAQATLTNDINYSDRIREYFIEEKSILLGIIGIGIIFAILLGKVRSMRI